MMVVQVNCKLWFKIIKYIADTGPINDTTHTAISVRILNDCRGTNTW